MNDFVAVKMVEADDYLCEVVLNFLVGERSRPIFYDFLQITLCRKVWYNKKLFAEVEFVDILDNEWVIDWLHDLFLSLKFESLISGHVLKRNQEDFYREGLVVGLPTHFVDCCDTALAEFLAEVNVVGEGVFGLSVTHK